MLVNTDLFSKFFFKTRLEIIFYIAIIIKTIIEQEILNTFWNMKIFVKPNWSFKSKIPE